MKYLRYLDILLFLGGKSRMFDKVNTSTILISQQLGVSQQTVSRKLKEMEKIGIINISSTNRGVSLSLTSHAAQFLIKIRNDVESILSADVRSFKGNVKEGLREGRYYVNKQGYQKQFIRNIGFRAYPGTLNIETDSNRFKRFIFNMKSIGISGFSAQGRSFGKLSCYNVNVISRKKKSIAVIIVPERNIHKKEIVELISPYNLRETLNLKTGNVIEIIKKDEILKGE